MLCLLSLHLKLNPCTTEEEDHTWSNCVALTVADGATVTKHVVAMHYHATQDGRSAMLGTA